MPLLDPSLKNIIGTLALHGALKPNSHENFCMLGMKKSCLISAKIFKHFLNLVVYSNQTKFKFTLLNPKPSKQLIRNQKVISFIQYLQQNAYFHSVFSNHSFVWCNGYNIHKQMVFQQNAYFRNVFSNHSFVWCYGYNIHKQMVFHQCEFVYVSSYQTYSP